MPVSAGHAYEAQVLNAYLGESNAKGTPGIFFNFGTDDGEIEHSLWITDGTRDRVAKTMNECFGVTLEQLKNRTFLDNLANELGGREVTITTIQEEYKGKPRVKVQWMNPKHKKAEGDMFGRVVSLFGGDPAPKKNGSGVASEPPPFPPDDDVPF